MTERYCPDCKVDVVKILSEWTEAMSPRKVNYCPKCGSELVDDS